MTVLFFCQGIILREIVVVDCLYRSSSDDSGIRRLCACGIGPEGLLQWG